MVVDAVATGVAADAPAPTTSGYSSDVRQKREANTSRAVCRHVKTA